MHTYLVKLAFFVEQKNELLQYKRVLVKFYRLLARGYSRNNIVKITNRDEGQNATFQFIK